MTPRHLVWSCQECEADFKAKHCLSDGKYCSYDPNHPKLDGKNIIYADLIAQYVYEKAYENPETRHKYWDYINILQKKCFGEITSFTCEATALKKLDFEKIDAVKSIFARFYRPGVGID